MFNLGNFLRSAGQTVSRGVQGIGSLFTRGRDERQAREAEAQAQVERARRTEKIRKEQEARLATQRTGGTGGTTGGGGGGGGGYGTGGTSGGTLTADSLISDSISQITTQFSDVFKNLEKLGPFTFDEELARRSAAERISPFYAQTLRDFLRGINLRRSRSAEDESKVLEELTQDVGTFTGRAKRSLELGLERAREGFAEAGLFSSGQALRRAGLEEVTGQESLQEFLTQAERKKELTRQTRARGLEDIGIEQEQKTRELARAQEFDVKSDIENQRTRAANKYALERSTVMGQLPGQSLDDYFKSQNRALGLL